MGRCSIDTEAIGQALLTQCGSWGDPGTAQEQLDLLNSPKTSIVEFGFESDTALETAWEGTQPLDGLPRACFLLSRLTAQYLNLLAIDHTSLLRTTPAGRASGKTRPFWHHVTTPASGICSMERVGGRSGTMNREKNVRNVVELTPLTAKPRTEHGGGRG